MLPWGGANFDPTGIILLLLNRRTADVVLFISYVAKFDTF